MKPTFFDNLGMADIERIHSQVINWLLCLDSSILNEQSKSDFLNKLFRIDEQGETKIDIKNPISDTEIDNIDIFINSTNHQFLVENKLKSSEHNRQTNKYDVPEQFKDTSKKVYYGFLTFINQ